MTAYYNENDPKAAAWLRELIRGGHIAQGEVDERSIEDVCVSDLRGYTQHHFFAGIGGWSYALRLAGWPDDRPVWTGSCPCQPFSAAGKRKGPADERNLWPAWQWLIKQYRPDCIFGEQVASKDGIAWLDTVSTDLEGEGYAVAPVVFPACGVGAYHKRDRIWFVGNSNMQRFEGQRLRLRSRGSFESTTEASGSSPSMAGQTRRPIADSHSGGMVNGESNGRNERWSEPIWRGVEWYRCQDGKYRPIKPGILPLVDGIRYRLGKRRSARSALLRGAGNAIVPQVAAQVIGAYMEIQEVMNE